VFEQALTKLHALADQVLRDVSDTDRENFSRILTDINAATDSDRR
jgi:hypothetical protein